MNKRHLGLMDIFSTPGNRLYIDAHDDGTGAVSVTLEDTESSISAPFDADTLIKALQEAKFPTREQK